MALSMVDAGVIGYPAKKRHPAATAPRATASLPSNKVKDIGSPLAKNPKSQAPNYLIFGAWNFH
jgi:hypothetical protein